MSQVFLASRNARKTTELQRILRHHLPDVVVVGADEIDDYHEPVEDEATFEGNALLKARSGLDTTGLPSLADDSGLCVDALGGMPGVLSARWAGRSRDDLANNTLLLDQLYDVPDQRRGAHFVCAVALCLPAAEGVVERVVTGRMDGRIIREMRGSGGFGYDVVFAPADDDRTTAELDVDEKDAISHRGKALRAMAPIVAAALTPAP